MRVGCIQVLFSAVYHLKTVILPFSSNLLKLSIKFLKDGSHKVLKSSFVQFHSSQYLKSICGGGGFGACIFEIPLIVDATAAYSSCSTSVFKTYHMPRVIEIMEFS